ncbi:MAG: lytic transglycosylase domain-containing protein [Nitrospirae bacterium]|nr:lytic transglycosylase domain-containing protein [Nitrospirota bacterium]
MPLTNIRMAAAQIKRILAVFPLLLFLMAAPAFADQEMLPILPDGSLNWQFLLNIGQKCSGGLSRDLLLAVIWAESSGNPYAINISKVGGFSPKTEEEAVRIMYRHGKASVDIGLMQVNYKAWGKGYGLSPVDLLDPAVNICVGSKILRRYLEEHNWSWRGIGRYNAVSIEKQATYAAKVYRTLRMIKNLQEYPHISRDVR